MHNSTGEVTKLTNSMIHNNRVPKFRLLIVSLVVLQCLATMAAGAEEDQPAGITELDTRQIKDLVQEVRRSVVVVTVEGREGENEALGSGFVVSSDGLVATNLHVVGEARPIRVQLESGQQHDVTSIHASDRRLDLAILKIDAHDLPELKLGDSDKLQQGQRIVVVGNPQGLNHSVVDGLLSGIRVVDDQKMLQLAMPIEKGNSGGPVIDLQGQVQGIVTLKSAVTRNLGFAVTVNDLKSLIQRPNPLPMSRWLTIGRLDPDKWQPLLGARWQQRAGRILAKGNGGDLLGRSLCISQSPLPPKPFELGVTVRLQDESGAAGLIFHCDGHQKHYGFYPSRGRLRLSRFDGPSFLSWNVLQEVQSEHYRPGEWNRLKVRFEEDGRLICYVNGQQVLESTDPVYREGQVGLAQFRNTKVEFKQFLIAEKIEVTSLTTEKTAEVLGIVDLGGQPENLRAKEIDKLAGFGTVALEVLELQARELTDRATELRRLRSKVHLSQIVQSLQKLVEEGDDKIDLLRGALLIAKLDDSEVDVPVYLEEIDRMAAELREDLADTASETARLERLNQYLFQENGFHGSRTQYYHPANSHLNRVLEDREGLPLTLSVLYIELAKRIGLDLVGVGLPGHFVAGWKTKEGTWKLVDVFNGGQSLDREAAGDLVLSITGRAMREEHLVASPQREILVRMLNNLMGIAQRDSDLEAVGRYVEATLAIHPGNHEARSMGILVNGRLGDTEKVLRDLDWILENVPPGTDIQQILQMRERIQAEQQDQAEKE
ncbi:MAG: hypothetical protein CMJ81_11260 [Planctomycetaceae bacterium]|nr:hypothetical protein [Planctomycetaceae bacterium]MBP63640.1 hypothetical protein [Planctomycetaceae bacterium]